MIRFTHITLIALSILFLTGCSNKKEEAQDPNKNLILAITKCSKLYTVQYNVHKVVTFDDIVSIKGSLFSEKFSFTIPGDRKIAIPIDATIKGFIDFSNFNETNVALNGDEITITLPDPQIVMTSSKIDHAGMKEYLSWNRAKFDEKEKEEYLKQGVASILSNMKNTDIIERSRINAFNTLQPIIMAAGYKAENIHIYFRNEIEKNAHEDSLFFNLINND